MSLKLGVRVSLEVKTERMIVMENKQEILNEIYTLSLKEESGTITETESDRHVILIRYCIKNDIEIPKYIYEIWG